MNYIPGQIIEFNDKDDGIRIGLVLSTGGKGVRVILSNKKETTISERNILHVTQSGRTGTSDIDRVIEVLAKCDAKRKELAESIDLDALHLLLSEDIRPYSLREMAGFLTETSDEDFEAAFLRQLSADSFYFKEKKEGWFPAPRIQVEEAIDREKKRKQRELDEQAFINELNLAYQKGTPTNIPPKVLSNLEKIVEYAVSYDDFKGEKHFADLLQKGGWANPRKLFSLLVKLGRFQPDENIFLIKNRIPTKFSSEITDATEKLADQADQERRDLQELFTWAIDGEETRDRDDAFSILKDPSGYSLWIHIADAAHFIRPESVLDREALERGASIYMPDQNLPMLPLSLSEDLISLNMGTERRCVTLKTRFSPDGILVEYEVFCSLVKINRAVDYASAEDLITSEPDLTTAVELAELLKSVRMKSGALIMVRPELEIKARDGKILVKQRERGLKTSEMIAEFMIWGNHLFARHAVEKKIPFAFRVQSAPENLPKPSEKFDPVEFFQIIRQLKRTVTSSEPGLHACLGVNPYCQVTSPMRRYCDLILQRQIKNSLAGLPPEYDNAALDQKLLISDMAVDIGEDAMQKRFNYFLFKHLKAEISKGNETTRAVVVDNGMNEVSVYFTDLCRLGKCKRPPFDLAVGNIVQIKFKLIDPFDETFKFEIQSVVTAP
ncbi:MAG: RNB domain-containing ribonuclease [Candidatus Riflebacteria bacterium]|nr:RNB domain-containing ribonuclease [Candidatus Riflebacteria bacterium]